MNDRNAAQQNWQKWFGESSSNHLDDSFKLWEKLSDRLKGLEISIQNKTALKLSSIQPELSKAKRNLSLDEPYRVVVIGETGSGKSTLINALLGIELLPAKAAAAVTGTAMRIHPCSDIEEELANHFKNGNRINSNQKFLNGFLVIQWRESEDFRELIKYYSQNYGLSLSIPLKEITPENLIHQSHEISDQINEVRKRQLIEEIQDIGMVWKHIQEGKHNEWKAPIPISETKTIESLLSEISPRNRDKTTRLITGIKYAEYFLPAQEEGFNNQELKHTILIDTPGSGATVIRHSLILKEEINNADAVVLVVRAARVNAQQAQDMANFLQSSLFKEFTLTEKNDFARKVFLIANQADELLSGQGDQEALEHSVQNLCMTISPDYWMRYGKASKHDCRYFETMSLLSLLSSLKAKGMPFSEDLYASQVMLLGIDYTTADPLQLIKRSQVSSFSRQLNKFLSQQRVDLMLRESNLYLDKAEEKLKFICEALLKSKGLGIEGNILNNYQKQAEHHRQLICKANLDKAEEDLNAIIKSLIESLDQWRESEQYSQNLLADVATSISNSLETSLTAYLLSEIQNSKSNIISETLNDLAGKFDTEGLPETLLLKAQKHFNQEIEMKSQILADFYLNRLDTEVALKKVSQEFYKKTYNQNYLSDIDPIRNIEEYQSSFRTEYRSICCWILMYESVKMPILLPAEKSLRKRSDAINGMFESAAEALGNSASSPVVREKISEIVNQMVPSPLNVFVDTIAELALYALSTPTKSSDFQKESYITKEYSKGDQLSQLMSKSQLIETVGQHIRNKAMDECVSIIHQQFSLRYRLALGIALTSLETLFFYELGKFSLKLQTLLEKLIERHRANVEVGNSSIQDALIAEDPEAGEEISQALELLSILSGSNESSIEENELIRLPKAKKAALASDVKLQGLMKAYDSERNQNEIFVPISNIVENLVKYDIVKSAEEGLSLIHQLYQKYSAAIRIEDVRGKAGRQFAMYPHRL